MRRVVIEKAKLKNIPKVEKIYKKTYIDEYRTQFPNANKKFILNKLKREFKKRLEGFKKGIYGKKWILFVAKSEEEIIGFGQAHTGLNDKSMGILDKLYVLKNYRRMGVGEKLTKEMINWLKKNKVKKLQGYILINNHASIKNIEKQGFKKIVYLVEKNLK